MTARLLWFIVGAGTATWWIKSPHGARAYHEHSQPIAYSQQLPHNSSEDETRGGPGSAHCRQPNVRASVQESRGCGPWETWPKWGWGRQQQQQQWTPPNWDDDRARWEAMSWQAAHTVTDLSEATLETLLTTVTALKTKLAESRVQREQEQRNGQSPEQKKEASRWV